MFMFMLGSKWVKKIKHQGGKDGNHGITVLVQAINRAELVEEIPR
jgi:hypothetical protein